MEEYKFEILINPSNLFDNVEEITSFISLSDNIDELEAFLIECEKEDLFEYCQVINTKINELRGNTLQSSY